MTYAEECEAARLECYQAREAARERIGNQPLGLVVAEILGDRQARSAEGLERRAAMWGAPPTGGSFSRGTAGRGMRTRNVRF
jgi:hypothetical protein